MFYVYVLQSLADVEHFYVGSTRDLRKRIASHNSGENKSTKHSSWRLVYYEAYVSEPVARRRERKLKQDGRAKRFLMQRIRESLEQT